MTKILVAYATKYGSTGDIARAIGETLAETGAETGVLPVRQVTDVRPYDRVVLGTPVFMGRPMRAAVRFASRFGPELRQKKTALFSVGLQMREDTPENRTSAMEFLVPLREALGGPADTGLFAGRIDPSRFGFLLRIFAKIEKTGLFAAGDWRDWDAIRNWARELV